MDIRSESLPATLLLLLLAAVPLQTAAQPPEPISDPAIQEWAARELSRRSTLESWCEVLKSSTEAEARELAVLWLASSLLPISDPTRQLSTIDRDAEALLEEARFDRDRRVAHLAEMLTARREGRAPDPRIAALPSTDELERVQRERWTPVQEALADPSPDMRLLALWWAGEILAGRGGTVDPREIAALAPLLSDPDPRVAHRAGEVLQTVVGDGAMPRH